MTVSRDDIAAHLNDQFSSLASAIGQTGSGDSSDGYTPDIDKALRKLGKTRSELPSATVEDAQEEAVFALAEFFALQRFWRRFGVFVNTKVDDSQFDYKQAQANAHTMMLEAKAVCAALGYDVAATGWSTGWLNLDWSENEPVEA
jgi:hypothetical protein